MSNFTRDTKMYPFKFVCYCLIWPNSTVLFDLDKLEFQVICSEYINVSWAAPRVVLKERNRRTLTWWHQTGLCQGPARLLGTWWIHLGAGTRLSWGLRVRYRGRRRWRPGRWSWRRPARRRREWWPWKMTKQDFSRASQSTPWKTLPSSCWCLLIKELMKKPSYVHCHFYYQAQFSEHC